MNHYDYIIIGSGIAGLNTALRAREHGSVLVITKGSIEDTNTKHAQGGVAAAIGTNDSPDLHFKDTIAAGDGLCNEGAVRILVDEAADSIADLVNLGMVFDTVEGEIALGREAAHSVSRILHAGGDATGEHIEVTLSNSIRSARIRVLEYSLVTKLVVEKGTVKGIEVLDTRSGSISQMECRFLILATGGAGQLYKFSTNPAIATSDGIALAFAAGAEITDVEFYQFHPTALHLPGVLPFLISEAVRGEGGLLRNVNGHRFMPDYSPDGELATRDVVSRSILNEMRRTGSDKVFLDVTHLPRRTITTRFPQIYAFCREHGLDITKEWIPIAPAAHYMIGGVKTNTWGETNINGLFACGEVACTGVHGANRLASNSLLEALVFSRRIVDKSLGTARDESNGKARAETLSIKPTNDLRCSLTPRKALTKAPPPSLAGLQTLLWDKVGIIRHKEDLTQAANILATWQKSLREPSDRPSYEISFLIQTGRLVTEAALIREESRGAHYRSDFPKTLPQWQRHIIFSR